MPTYHAASICCVYSHYKLLGYLQICERYLSNSLTVLVGYVCKLLVSMLQVQKGILGDVAQLTAFAITSSLDSAACLTNLAMHVLYIAVLQSIQYKLQSRSFSANLGSMPSLKHASTERGLVGSKLKALGSACIDMLS